MSRRYFPIDEYEGRWERIQEAMKQRGLSTVLVWGRSGGTYDRAGDVLYLTNYYGNNSGQGYDNPYTHCRAFSAVILRAGQEPELLVDDSWPRMDLIATSRVSWSRNPGAAAAKALLEGGASGRVGICGTDFFPMKYWNELREATPGIEWVPVDDLVLQVRKVKSARELEAVRRAGYISTKAMSAMIEGLMTNMSEAEAAGEAAREVVRHGGAIHMMPCSHGEDIHYFVSNPITGYSQAKPQPGDLARAFVYGPMFEGYYSDPGRTIVIGNKQTSAQRELLEAGAGMCDRLLAAIRPGMPVRELAEMGDRILLDMGSEKDQAADKFPIYGHGLGLFFEKPYISTVMGDPEDVFLENMVVGIETFVGREGVGSAGFEQNAIITKDGVELITTTPMLW